MPSLASFAIFCYSQQSHLFYSNKPVTSLSGVQQRGSLDPLMFSLTLWPIIEVMETKIPNLTHCCWYIDDDFIAGTETELREALDMSTVLGETCRLELRTGKFGVWSNGAVNKVDWRIKRNSE